jgi:5-methylcytosine-specific restriction endonuclease McrA
MVMKINRQEVYDKCYGHCGYCGCEITFKEMQVDHIVSQFHFKLKLQEKYTNKEMNDISNLLPTCRVCNKWKSSHSVEQFRKEIGEQLRRLNEYNPNFRFAKKYNLVQETPHPIKFYFELLNINPHD